MGAEDEQAKLVSGTDVRFNWISDRTCSSLKVKEDSFQRLLASEAKYSLVFVFEQLMLLFPSILNPKQCLLGRLIFCPSFGGNA